MIFNIFYVYLFGEVANSLGWCLRSQSPYLEVLVLLSGTEESTGAVVEARHSYTLEDPWQMSIPRSYVQVLHATGIA